MRPLLKLVACLAAILAVVATLISPARAAGLPALVVTEIAPDHASYDNFEFFEVTNTTSAPVDLAGYTVAYSYANSADTTRDVKLALEPTVVPAGGTVVVWLKYTATNVDSFAKTDTDFRTNWGDATSTYPIVAATGQPGMANGGERGIRLTAPDGTATWSFYPTGSVSASGTAHFSAAETPSQTLFAGNAPATPGTVDPGQVTPPVSPSPTVTPTDSASPSPSPTVSPSPSVSPSPTTSPDPNLDVAILQVTELLPDSTNVGTADGYEFIEVYNATDAPVDFSDFTINYLYPNPDLTIGSNAVWPAVPADVVIPAGETLVFWIKNGQNQHLVAADFNRQFGTSLVAGQDLVEMSSGGMANGSLRGIEVITNTGVVINRTIYNNGADDVTANLGIHYTGSADKTLQKIAGTSAATPGAVSATQVPAALMAVAPDAVAPVVTDATAATIPAGKDFRIQHTITDDVLVRTATLHVRSSVDAEPTAYNLLVGSEDSYTWTIPAADLTGKRWFEYWLETTDGTNTTRTDVRRVALEGVNTDPVRLNLADGQYVNGTTQVVVGTEGPSTGLQLSVAGTDVTAQLVPALEGRPVFVFDVTGVNSYFQNGVLVDGDVLHIFDGFIQGTWETMSVPVPEAHLTRGEPLTVEVWAGTKKAPEIDLNENNDDFEIRDVRLVLPDGRTLRPADFIDSATILRMGDSAGKLDFYPATFDVPADAFSALGYTWDTTTVADGTYPVAATLGSNSDSASVIVDNTAPVVTTSIADGSTQKGAFTLDATAVDAGIGTETVTVTLDGERIETPQQTSSLDLTAGSHTLVVTAVDKLGNRTTKTVGFTTPEEQPAVDLGGPADGATVRPGVTLSATVTDPTQDRLSGSFNVGYHFDHADAGVTLTGGVTTHSEATTREVRSGVAVGSAITSDEFLPYQQFAVAIPDGAGADYRARLRWAGEVNGGSRVSMSVKTADGAWRRVAETVAGAGESAAVELDALVPAAGNAVNGTLTVLIQHTDGWAGGNRTTRASSVTPFHAGAELRSGYDFTVAHMSDTQYYNANAAYYKHQIGINDFLLDQRDELNLAYVAHTGDIVDNNEIPEQWDRANPQYAKFDAAGLPYGVLAGNHDVSQAESDYTEYGQHFGDARFADNPWFGGSHLNNRGHYDLISAGGIDFLHLYMGWGAGDEQIEWMNSILKRYPERVAIINLHEYMLTTGGLGAIPQRIFDEVVTPNSNVRMVQSGHYHDAFTRTDSFDDDGDGTDDRTVVSMLFDYQGLPEGGQGFVRLQHYDNVGRQILVRTYSPTLAKFTSEDPTLSPEHQTFEISYDTVGINPATKSLTTTSFSADILTTQVIGSFADVASGSTVTARWAKPVAGAGWYVTTRDAFGGEAISAVRAVVPTASPSPTGTHVPFTDVYSTPGYHNVGGRLWFTRCEPYSRTVRCFTHIWATQVVPTGGRFVPKTDWYFNSLTYLPMMTRAEWGTSHLANAGEYTIEGRRWRTECDTALTGRNNCRSFVWASYVAGTALPGGGYRYAWTQGWLLNNMVRFRVG